MEKPLKQRLAGAVALVALAVIFLPLLLDGEGRREMPGTGPDSAVSRPQQPAIVFDQHFPELEREAMVAKPGIALGESAALPMARKLDTEGKISKVAATAPEPGQLVPDKTPVKTPEKKLKQPGTIAKPGADPAALQKRKAAETPPVSWIVQIGAFGQEENAASLEKKLKSRGYRKAFRDTSGRGGKTLHLVKIGPEKERGRALAIATELKQKYSLDAIVLEHKK